MAKTAPTEEEFEAWRDHPVTQWVIGAFDLVAEEQKKAWLEATWDAGHCDSYSLCELKTRADTYQAMKDADYSDFLATYEKDSE
jgi:hypothetical protein